jgi:hypothetical protein
MGVDGRLPILAGKGLYFMRTMLDCAIYKHIYRAVFVTHIFAHVLFDARANTYMHTRAHTDVPSIRTPISYAHQPL